MNDIYLLLIDKYFIYFYVLSAGLIIFLSYKKRLLDFFISLALAGVVSEGIKYLINKPRPLETVGNAMFEGASFPSTHTAVAFTSFFFIMISCRFMSTFVIKEKGRAGVLIKAVIAGLLFTGAFVAGILRVIVGAHFSIDVFAGIILGLVISIPFRYYDVAARRLK